MEEQEETRQLALKETEEMFFYYNVCGNYVITCSDWLYCSDYLIVD